MEVEAKLAGADAGTRCDATSNCTVVSSGMGRVLISAVLIPIVLVGGYRLFWRAMPDALVSAADLRTQVLCARAWVDGLNPYEKDAQRVEWRKIRAPGQGEIDDIPNYFEQEVSLYPPTAFPVMTPLTWVPWSSLRGAWWIQNCVLTVLGYLALCNLMGLSLLNWRAQLLAALWLMLGPFITSMKLGTLTLPAVMLIVITIWAVSKARFTLAGILLGIATTMKPQVGGALLLFYFLQPVKRTAWVATGFLVIATVVGVTRLWIARIDWLPTLRASLKYISRPGGFNDPSRLNSSAWQIVNLQYMLFGSLHNRTLISGIALLTALILSALFLIVWQKSQSATAMNHRGDGVTRQSTNPAAREALAASIPLLICLLPVYHRYYDCLVLTIPLAWGIAFIGTRLNFYAWLAVLGTAPFYVNVPYVLDLLSARGSVPARIAASWWWQTLIMPCQVWTLLALIIVLIAALQRMPGESSRGTASDC